MAKQLCEEEYMQLETVGLKKSFGQKRVLENVSFIAESGRALGILGRNGAGKTTTIRIILNIFPPDDGRVLLDGSPLSRSKVRIGYMPEERGLYPKRSIGIQLVYLGRLRGLTAMEAEISAKRLLARVSMSDAFKARLDTLSKGNQQKIQLAAALINDPDVAILDEPFSGLDPVNAQLLKDVIREQVDAGKIVLFSSHQMNYVEEFRDSIALLHGGKIVLGGALDEIKRAYPRYKLLLLSDIDDPSRLPGVARCESAPLPYPRGSKILTLNDPSRKDEVFAALSGASVERFEVLEPTLEQIFVEKAGENE
jgi:ABC-2 type transport system ATP-binding protein